MGIWELEIRKPLTKLRARRVSIRQACTSGMPERSRRIEAVVIAFYRHAHSRVAEKVIY